MASEGGPETVGEEPGTASASASASGSAAAPSGNQWAEQPAEQPALREWMRVLDPSSGEWYWYNQVERRSQWDRPAGWDESMKEAAYGTRTVHLAPELRAAMVIQGVFRA